MSKCSSQKVRGKIKVIAFSTSYHPFIGGAEVALEEIARRLSQDFDFFIITARFKKNLPKREKRPEGTIIRFGFGIPFDKYLLIPFSLFYCFWKLGFGNWKLRDSEGIVLWGMELSHGSLAAAFLKFFLRSLPFIFTIQYGYGEKRISRGRFGIIPYSLRFILSRANHVTAISSHLLALTRKYGYGGPADLIPNGVDIEKFKIKNEKLKTADKKIVITTSRLVPKNGVDTLISAIYEVRKIIPEIKCWIIGDGPERASYESQIVNYRLQDNIKLFGAVPYDRIPEYLHGADIFARPSRSEGMGNSFVEALAAGLPIIGTSVEGILDIIQDGKTGFFVKVDDPKDLAGKIIFLINNPEIAKAAADAGRRMVEEKFSWDVVRTSFKKIFSRYSAFHPLNILILTPIYPPQIGGPALYAKNFGDEFRKLGHKVEILSFGSFISYPRGIRHSLYFFKVLKLAFTNNIIFSLDSFSVGVPAMLSAFIFRKVFVLRLEGDFLWESFIERIRHPVSLRAFYEKKAPLSFKERFIRYASFLAARRADAVVFSSLWRKDLTARLMKLKPQNIFIIRNAWPKYLPRLGIGKIESEKKIIIWAGRMIYLKNLYSFIRAFGRANRGDYELHLIGEGPEKKFLIDFVEKEGVSNIIFMPPMDHDKIMEKISDAAFLVLPSFSDVGPNVIADAIANKTPFIMTKESGYKEYLEDIGIFIDPFDNKDMTNKIKLLMDSGEQNKFRQRFNQMSLNRGWREAAEEWITLFLKLI